MSDKNNTFTYTYSAEEQAEIKKIRERYAPNGEREETPLERLRRLDRESTRKGTVLSLILGLLGILLLGCGMSLLMSDFAQILGSYIAYALPIGAVVGVIGIVLITLAYPIYRIVTERERARIAPEILRLSEELMR